MRISPKVIMKISPGAPMSILSGESARIPTGLVMIFSSSSYGDFPGIATGFLPEFPADIPPGVLTGISSAVKTEIHSRVPA